MGRQFELSFAWRPSAGRFRADAGLTRLSKGSFVGSVLPDRAGTSLYYYLSTTIEFGN